MAVNWKSIVKSIAPVIGTALGGPMAGAAVKMLSSKLLGKEDGTEAELEQFISTASPDQLLQIKQIDNDFKLSMKALDVDVFKLEQEGRANARENHKDHFMPTLICIVLTLVVTVIAVGLMITTIPESNEGILNMIIGQVLTAWIGSVAYWVGTTKSSSDKSKLLGPVRS